MDGHHHPDQDDPGGRFRRRSVLIDNRIRVGIDAHAAEKKGTGNCTYIRNFLLALKSIDAVNSYILYTNDRRNPFYSHFLDHPNFTVKSFPVRSQYIRVPLFLALASSYDGLDILHVQYNAPPFHRGSLVVTIHDLCFLHFPGFFSRLQGLRLKVLTRFTAQKAKRVITGSHYSKNDIIQNYGIESSKISVVPYGVSSDFGPQNRSPRIRDILNKYGIHEKYLLCVGRLNPRKNLISLVDAFGRLKAKKRIPHKLVIVGIEDFSAIQILRSIEDIVPGDVLFTGYVDEADLSAVYSGAEIFVYPSLFEGVGLPVLEAMKSGVPVVTSNTTSLREIVQDAAITVDPLDVEALFQAIWMLIDDAALKAEHIRRGRMRTEDFCWEMTARKTVDIYREVCGRK